jgi:hypothetical protein
MFVFDIISIHTYIKSRPFAIGVGRDHLLPLAVINIAYILCTIYVCMFIRYLVSITQVRNPLTAATSLGVKRFRALIPRKDIL